MFIIAGLLVSFHNIFSIYASVQKIKKTTVVSFIQSYSDDWIKTIRTMLKVKHQARPTAE